MEAFQDQVAVTHAVYGAEAVPSRATSKGLFQILQASATEPRLTTATPQTTQVAYRAPQPTFNRPAATPAMIATTPTPLKAMSAPAAEITPAVAIGSDSSTDATKVEAACVRVLRGSTAKEQHAAIRDLVRYDWKKHPIVASALVAGAMSDSTNEVRVDCIRHLAHYQMSHSDVITALTSLGTDSDTWVRDEASKARVILSNLR